MIRTRGNPKTTDVIHFTLHKKHPNCSSVQVPEPYCRTGNWHVKLTDSWKEVTCKFCKG
jgi:hypothetical protein